MVTINFTSVVKSVAKGVSSIVIDREGTVNEIINELSRIYGSEFESKLLNKGTLKRYINVYLNGKDIRFIDNLDSYVRNNDTLDFIPAVSGGLD